MRSEKKNPLQIRLEYQKKMRELRKESRKKKNKFNANFVRDPKGGFKGSALEISVLALYRFQERQSDINGLRHQHQVYFTEADIGWRLDFSFIRNGVQCYGEAKGFETADYALKLKLWRVYGLGPLEIWKGDANRPILVETVIPKLPSEKIKI